MVGEKLHEFDLELSDYVAGNIRQYLQEKRFAAAARRHLHPEMLAYLFDRLNPDVEEQYLLLSDDEFHELALAFDGDVPDLDREWVADPALHKRYVYSVKEIRTELTRQEAESWSRACVRFAKRLCKAQLTLGEGIKIVGGWVHHLRRLLRAMEAMDLLPCPEGRSPTPTKPTPVVPASAVRDAADLEAVDALRKAIAAHDDGVTAPAKVLILRAGIREQRGLDALRFLESLGEYKGFTRRPSKRRRSR